MKRLITTVMFVWGGLLLVAACAVAGNKAQYFKGTSVDVIGENLAVALNTPCPGMQASAAQTVRDLRALLPEQEFTNVVIPLMRIVKDEDASVPVRTLAALALHDLKSARGDFAIERVALFSGNEHMRRLCTWLAVEKYSPQTTVVPASDLSDAR